MISLYNVVKTICPEYELTHEKVEIKKKIVKLENTNFECQTSYEQLLQCVLHNLYDCYDVQEHIDTIYEFINNTTFIESFNIKKILLSMQQGIVNNDVILFLSAYYEMNIYVYHEESKLIKVYYIENNLSFTKQCCLLTFTQDIQQKAIYQTTIESISNEDVDNLLPDMLKISIGLTLNKILVVGENAEEVKYIVDDVKEAKIGTIVMFPESLVEDLNVMNVDSLNAYFNTVVDYVSKAKKIKIIKSK
jgi:hypothetical protein